MLNHRRSIIFWLGTVPFTVIAVGGHAVHLLSDCPAHGHHHAVATCEGDCPFGHSNDDSGGTDGWQFERIEHDNHACPICQYLAQSQLDSPAVSSEFQADFSLIARLGSGIEPVASRISSHSPRGPPSLI